MNDVSTPNGHPEAVSPPGKLAYATPTSAPLVAGRRSFFKYREASTYLIVIVLLSLVLDRLSRALGLGRTRFL